MQTKEILSSVCSRLPGVKLEDMQNLLHHKLDRIMIDFFPWAFKAVLSSNLLIASFVPKQRVECQILKLSCKFFGAISETNLEDLRLKEISSF